MIIAYNVNGTLLIYTISSRKDFWSDALEKNAYKEVRNEQKETRPKKKKKDVRNISALRGCMIILLLNFIDGV